jgi:hypothetical protein
MSEDTANENETTQTIAVCPLTEYENKLIRHIVYVRQYLIRDFFYEALDFFINFREEYKPDSSRFEDQGLYYTYGKKQHNVKLSVALGKEYRAKLEALAEEDDRDLRMVIRTAVIQYLNHLKLTGELDTYEEDLKKTRFKDKA